MAIKMPPPPDWSDEQGDLFANAPLGKNILVLGPPGTGKTVMGIHLANRAVRDGQMGKVNLLMFNHTLRAYAGDWEGLESGVGVFTYHQWGYRLGRTVADEMPCFPGDSYAYDWQSFRAALERSPQSIGCVVVDEGQDLPPDFYSVVGMTSQLSPGACMVVTADENQQITKGQNSDIKQIRAGLSSGLPLDEFCLTRNYRNSRPIAELAGEFYVGLESGVPALPERRGSSPNLRWKASLEEMLEPAMNTVRTGTESVLVICPDAKTVKDAFAVMREGLAGDRCRVEAYLSPKKWLAGDKEWRVGEPGVASIVHFRSMKGLEADAVYVPRVERMNFGKGNAIYESMYLYVMSSRARNRLEFVATTGSPEGGSLMPLLRRAIAKGLLRERR